jgi:hypothetical protein
MKLNFEEMTCEQRSEAIERALDEIPAKLASGEINRAGRYWTDEELAAGAATGKIRQPANSEKADAA